MADKLSRRALLTGVAAAAIAPALPPSIVADKAVVSAPGAAALDVGVYSWSDVTIQVAGRTLWSGPAQISHGVEVEPISLPARVSMSAQFERQP